jgi:hypothetical protein
MAAFGCSPRIPPTIQQSITIAEDEVRHSGPAPLPLSGTVRDSFNSIVVLMFNSLLLTALATKHREKKIKGWQ